jgi:hypothetical protein
MLTARGILCKVNSVMIPGINDKHLVEVSLQAPLDWAPAPTDGSSPADPGYGPAAAGRC